LFPGLDAGARDRPCDHWGGASALHRDGPACVRAATGPGLRLSDHSEHADHLAALLEGLVIMNEVDTTKQAPLREMDTGAPAPLREVDMGTSAPVRKAIGRLIGICIIAGAVVAIALTVWQWQVHPQTDDATVRANFIGVAPEVSGHIVELPVQDNQFV